MQENLRQGLQKDDAEIQVSHRLLPVYRKKLGHLYLQYVRWYHDLKTDPVHKKVMKTIRSFMEDDEMDYTEAVEAAISKRKYLLNSLFDLEHFPTEDLASTEDDDFTYEPMKRKYVMEELMTLSTEGGKGGVTIPFHAQILTKFTCHAQFKQNFTNHEIQHK